MQQMKMEKLTADARAARDLAVAAAQASDDGGTCNLDCAYYTLAKGERAKAVMEALAAADLVTYCSTYMGRKRVFICPPAGGQANSRYVANQALVRYLRAQGWDNVFPYYQMD